MGTPAFATMLINGDNGGKMEDYTARFRQVRDSGDSVIIDGTCMSACTMVLGLVPHDRICATPNAVLGFHAAWEFNKSGGRIASPSGRLNVLLTSLKRMTGSTPDMSYMARSDTAR